MASRVDLQALIERVEKAEAGSRELDWRIADVTDHPSFEKRLENMWPPFGAGSKMDRAIPPYTASVDAAIALLERVLPGWRAEIRWGDWPQHIERHDATLWNNDTSKRESVFGVSANAATLPLAIIAATLRAMQSQENE